MAQAVLALWPEAKYAIGPPIEDGFYYDFDIGRPFTPEDLERIEAQMREIIAEDQVFIREELSLEDASKIFADQPYKLEIIEGIGEESGSQGVAEDKVSIYRNNGAFVDLCRGPHLPSTGRILAFKLLRTSGAYWRGDESREMLQRIYGTAWESPEALEEYLARLDEAERRDHRRLGRELDLFSLPSDLGPGLVLWHPKGGRLRKELIGYVEEIHAARGYEFVSTPHLAKSQIWQTSGHLEQYRENMYPPMMGAGVEYFVKPMNCPFHVYIYKSHTRSYRELPIRLYELGTVYRYERTGVIHGALRLRGFTQDDAHIFCRDDQLVEELLSVVELTLALYEPFGFSDPDIKLSTFPGKAIGTPEMWEQATDALRKALEASGRPYKIAEGEGAFYGPKIDFDYRDAIGRPWQLTTIQCDFALPERFELEYMGSDNMRYRPVMIHRAIFGSLERFTAVLIEHYAGAFPTWLAPVQATVIPIADRHGIYAQKVASELHQMGVRVEVDASGETLNSKIRKAQLQKIPYMLVVGDKEVEAATVAVRPRTGNERRGVPIGDFISEITSEIARRDSPESVA
jgi:threonyl-tRNA synthetase